MSQWVGKVAGHYMFSPFLSQGIALIRDKFHLASIRFPWLTLRSVSWLVFSLTENLSRENVNPTPHSQQRVCRLSIAAASCCQ